MNENLQFYFTQNEIDYLLENFNNKKIKKFLNILNSADDFDKSYGIISVNNLIHDEMVYTESIIEASIIAIQINEEFNLKLINELTDEYKTFQQAYFMFKDCELPPVRFYILNKNKKQYIKILKNLVKNKILRGLKNE